MSAPLSENPASVKKIKAAVNTLYSDPQMGLSAHLHIGKFFYQLPAPQTAVQEYKKALVYLDQLDHQEDRAAMRVELYLDMAHELKLLSESDSALICYNKALQVAQLAGNNSLISNVSLRLGDWFYDQKIYTEALKYYTQAAIDPSLNKKLSVKKALVAMASGKGNLDDLDNLYLQLSASDPENQQFYLAFANWLINQHYLLQSKSILPQIDTSSAVAPELRIEALKTYANYFLEVMDNNRARKILKDIDRVNSQLEKRAFPQDVKWASWLTENTPNQSLANKKTKDKPKKGNIAILILGFSTGFFLLAFLIALSSKNQYKRDLHTALNTVNHEPPKERSPEWVGHVDRGILEAMLAKLHEIQATETPEQALVRINDLTFELESLLNLGRERPRLLENVDFLFAEFYFNLADNFPMLDRTEQELMGLVRLNLNVTEIASLWNISEKSAQLHLDELQIKINLPEADDLYVYVANL